MHSNSIFLTIGLEFIVNNKKTSYLFESNSLSLVLIYYLLLVTDQNKHEEPYPCQIPQIPLSLHWSPWVFKHFWSKNATGMNYYLRTEKP